MDSQYAAIALNQNVPDVLGGLADNAYSIVPAGSQRRVSARPVANCLSAGSGFPESAAGEYEPCEPSPASRRNDIRRKLLSRPAPKIPVVLKRRYLTLRQASEELVLLRLGQQA
jgi:hypothetical protein